MLRSFGRGVFFFALLPLGDDYEAGTQEWFFVFSSFASRMVSLFLFFCL